MLLGASYFYFERELINIKKLWEFLDQDTKMKI